MSAGRTCDAAAARGRPRLGAHLAVQLAAAFTLLLLQLLVMAGLAQGEPKFPPLTGRIVDEAGLLTPADRGEILELLRGLEGKPTDQVVVYTTRSLQGYEIEDFGYRLGRHWRIGQQGVNNGIVLIVAPTERKVRIEVGRGLEPIMTDLMSGLIVNNVVLPAFRRGEFSAGIKAGVRDIRDVLLGDAEEVRRRAEAGRRRDAGGSDWTTVLFFLLVVGVILFVVWSEHRQAAARPAGLPGSPRGPPARRHIDQRPSRGWPGRDDGGIVIIPGGGSGGWGGSSGRSDPDAGWSGGGGDFGGGGASGSW